MLEFHSFESFCFIQDIFYADVGVLVGIFCACVRVRLRAKLFESLSQGERYKSLKEIEISILYRIRRIYSKCVRRKSSRSAAQITSTHSQMQLTRFSFFLDL